MTYKKLFDAIVSLPDQKINVGAETIHSTHHTSNVIYTTLEYYRSIDTKKITQPMKANKNNLQKIYDVLYCETK